MRTVRNQDGGENLRGRALNWVAVTEYIFKWLAYRREVLEKGGARGSKASDCAWQRGGGRLRRKTNRLVKRRGPGVSPEGTRCRTGTGQSTEHARKSPSERGGYRRGGVKIESRKTAREGGAGGK